MEVNGYNLTRAWFDWRFENPDKGSFKHAEIYFYIVDLWNRLGQKSKLRLPINNLKESLGVGNRNTIYSALKDLEEWGFIKTISEAKNQNQSRIITITACTLFEQPGEQALDQANEQALEQANEQALEQPYEQPSEHIDKQLNKGTTEQKNKGKHLFKNSDYFDKQKFKEAFRGTDYENRDLDYYYEAVYNWSEANGTKKKDWIATARNFMLKDSKNEKTETNGRPNIPGL